MENVNLNSLLSIIHMIQAAALMTKVISPTTNPQILTTCWDCLNSMLITFDKLGFVGLMHSHGH